MSASRFSAIQLLEIFASLFAVRSD